MHSPQLFRSIRVDEYDTMKLCYGQLLVTKLVDDKQQQILACSLSDTKSTPKILWQSAETLPKRPKAILTSTLPLELELIVQGYCKQILYFTSVFSD